MESNSIYYRLGATPQGSYQFEGQASSTKLKKNGGQSHFFYEKCLAKLP